MRITSSTPPLPSVRTRVLPLFQRQWRGVAGCLLIMVLLAGLPPISVNAANRELDENRRELEAIQQRIGRTAQTLEEKKKQERAANADLVKVEKSLAAMGERVNAIGSRLLELEQRVSGVQGEIGRTGAEIDGLRRQVQRRLVALYKGGGAQPAQALFSARPAAELAQDYVYWEHVVRHDQALLGNYRSRLDNQQQDLRQLDELRREQQRLLAEQQSERESMRKAARVKQQLLASVRKDKDYLARELAELKERAARADALIRRLESARNREPLVAGTRFAEQKGRLPWPVTGRVRIPFGNGLHPELGTQYQSQGVELEVTGERSVAAVWPGKIVFASWFKGYGNLLIVDHGDGYYTLYAQLARLDRQVGEKVSRGETLALTDGREGRFYFEVRKGGVPLNPTEWLE